MKKLFLAVFTLHLLLSSTTAEARTASRQRQSGPKRQLGRDFEFDGTTIKGKYQYPVESAVTVEDDKLLNDLLGVRKDFKDRIKAETNRY